MQVHPACLCDSACLALDDVLSKSASENSARPYVGVVRALGAEVAELPALAVRPELQGNTLGRLLLAALEDVLREAGVKLVAMPALVPFPTSSPRQGMASDGQTPAPPTNEQVSSYHAVHQGTRHPASCTS